MDRKVNALEWWRQNQAEFPNLSKMAQDYLAIPATSVPSERVFSDVGQLVYDRRNRLNGETIRACICLDSWWTFAKLGFQL